MIHSSSRSTILMLWPSLSDDFPKYINQNFPNLVDHEPLYDSCGLLKRAKRYVLSVCGLSTKSYLSSWIDRLNSYQNIIINANVINSTVPATLRKIGYRGRIIYWYWNPVDGETSPKPSKSLRKHSELWSFTQSDCMRYNLRFNSTYYFMNPEPVTTNNGTIYFVGRDKGRYEELCALKSKIEQLGIKTDFHIIADKKSPKGNNYSPFIAYSNVIATLKKSGAILEILQEGQEGYSLRVMESLFFNKKLISNNPLLKYAPFYNSNNIFIIDNSNLKGLADFMSRPFVQVKSGLIDYYRFDNWLSRFEM